MLYPIYPHTHIRVIQLLVTMGYTGHIPRQELIVQNEIVEIIV